MKKNYRFFVILMQPASLEEKKNETWRATQGGEGGKKNHRRRKSFLTRAKISHQTSKMTRLHFFVIVFFFKSFFFQFVFLQSAP